MAAVEFPYAKSRKIVTIVLGYGRLKMVIAKAYRLIELTITPGIRQKIADGQPRLCSKTIEGLILILHITAKRIPLKNGLEL